MPGNNHYIYILRPTRPAMLSEGLTPEEEGIVDEHFAYLQDLTEKGIVLLAGRTTNNDETAFGIVIFHADHEDAARDLMLADPAVKGGVMKAELFPFRAALKTEA